MLFLFLCFLCTSLFSFITVDTVGNFPIAVPPSSSDCYIHTGVMTQFVSEHTGADCLMGIAALGRVF